MANIRRVLLCGKSLLISGLQSTLQQAPGLDLQLVEPREERIQELIREWQPDILILENELFVRPFYLSLLKDFPQLKLIGVEIEENHLLVFSGRGACAPTTVDLLQIIEA